MIIKNNTYKINTHFILTAQEYWYLDAKQSIESALKLEKLNTNRARNVVLFLGDGMSVATVSAARILKGQQNLQPGEEGYLSWETFPHAALSKVGILCLRPT